MSLTPFPPRADATAGYQVIEHSWNEHLAREADASQEGLVRSIAIMFDLPPQVVARALGVEAPRDGMAERLLNLARRRGIVQVRAACR